MRSRNPGLVRMRMASRRDAVGPTVERIIEAVEDAGLDSDQKLDLAVALAEALSNAAVHGNRLRPRSRVIVTVYVTPGERTTIEVKDSGRGFDVSGLSDPTDRDRILAPSGRGVFLMRKLVDKVEFFPPGNRVSLTVEAR
ncbi:MAG TPA: ATP-binding protein [Vicinamibacteria bacterium]